MKLRKIDLWKFLSESSTQEIEELDGMFKTEYGDKGYKYMIPISQMDNNSFRVFLRDRTYSIDIFRISRVGWYIFFKNNFNNSYIENDKDLPEHDFLIQKVVEISKKYYPQDPKIAKMFEAVRKYVYDNFKEDKATIKIIKEMTLEPVIQIYTFIGEKDHNHMEFGYGMCSGGWYSDWGKYYDNYPDWLKEKYQKCSNYMYTLKDSLNI